MEKEIKGYTIQQEIGEGGFAKVYRAHQPLIDREVAIKVILPIHANQPEFVRRFDAEAQLVARLEHPHIVPLYDYWRDPTGAFLVMRWLRGGNLMERIRAVDYTVDLAGIARMLDQITGALSIAHRHEIIHQDIKPENILLDEDGNAYLSDFGIAHDLKTGINLATISGSNIVHGSPSYISPEHLLQDRVTYKSDIYSLGLLLYEMLTGKKPWEGADETNQIDFLRQRFKTLKLPALQTTNPDLPECLNQIVWQATARKQSDRYADVTQIARDFRLCIEQKYYLAAAPDSPITLTDATGDKGVSPLIFTTEPLNPYKGLRPFQEADAADFFGRQTLIKRLAERLAEAGDYARFLAVVGPSGSGKSSVVKAGLIPAIRRGQIPGFSKAFIAQMNPGSNPLRELEGAILRMATRADDAFIRSLSSGEYTLSTIVEQALPPDDSQFLLVIDQFEEVFTLVEDEQIRTNFLAKIYEAVTAPNRRMTIIVTLRGDFFDRPLLYPGLGLLLQSRTEVVLPLSEQELEEAMRGPANRVGLVLETGLVETIIADISQQPNILPLLQYLLTELYEQREHLKLTLAAYRAGGGISGALARRAEELYTGFTVAQQEAARQLFLRLVKLGEGAEDTRRRALQSELYSIKSDLAITRQVMEAYGKYRLLTFDHDPITRTPTVEVAHEALIRRWQRFQEWLDSSRDELRIQARLTQATKEWLNAKRNSGFLAGGARLSQFASLAKEGSLVLSQDEHAYIEAGLALRRQRGRIRKELFLLLVSFLILVTILWQKAEEAQAKADIQAKIARARELAALALNHSEDLDLSFLLSLEALDIVDIFEARNSLLTGLQSQPQLETFLNGHTGPIRSLAFSPDGRFIASASADTTLIIWDANTHQPIGQPLVGHTDRVNTLAFSPDGLRLVSGGDDNTICVWNVETRELLNQITTEHIGGIRSVTVHPNGEIVASGGMDNSIRLWDITTGAMITNFPGHEDGVYSLAFSPDGQTLASGGGDGMVRLWDTESWESRELAGHTNWVLSLAFSSNGQILASGSADQTIRLWNANTGRSLSGALTGHRGWVRSLNFSAEGNLLLSGGTDGLVLVWDVATRQLADWFVNLEEAEVWSAVFSPDSQRIVVGGGDNAISLWYRAAPPALGRALNDHTDEVLSVAFHPNAPLLASAGGVLGDTTIRLWNVSTGTVQTMLSGHQGAVLALAFNPTMPGQLAAADLTQAVWIWNTELAERVGAIELGDTTFALAYSPDGQLLALGMNDGTINLWNITGDPADWHSAGDPLVGHTHRVVDVAFSPDGALLASASRDGTIRLWDVATGQPVGQPLTGHTDGVLSVAFSPDGQRLASGSRDTTVRLWDVAAGLSLGAPLSADSGGHTGWVMDVAFSPDGRYLASAGGDGKLILWDAMLRRPIGQPLAGHTDWVNSLAFSSDGAYLASGSRDTTVIVWSMGLDSWRARACSIANRSLTANELQLYFLDIESHLVCADS